MNLKQITSKLNLSGVKPGYRPQASDTTIETDIFEFTLLRQRSNSDRLQMSATLTKGARQQPNNISQKLKYLPRGF